jgi:hypothetical protein
MVVVTFVVGTVVVVTAVVMVVVKAEVMAEGTVQVVVAIQTHPLLCGPLFVPRDRCDVRSVPTADAIKAVVASAGVDEEAVDVVVFAVAGADAIPPPAAATATAMTVVLAVA